MKPLTLLALGALLPLSVSATMIQGVPAYTWTLGCVPTATAELLGYWDLHGYDKLLAASGQDVYVTTNVISEIGELAQRFHTDASGTTYFFDYFTGLADYGAARGIAIESTGATYGNFDPAWNWYKSEIDAGNPMMLLVDPYGGLTSALHAVAAFGYEYRNGVPWYAFYNTWGEDEVVQWAPFVMATGPRWGVAGEIDIHMPKLAAMPEPNETFLLLVVFGLLYFPAKRAGILTRGRGGS